jgi:hypothetical protein
MHAPVIQPARGEQRKVTTSATSSGRPKRPAGISLLTKAAIPAGSLCWRRSQPPPGKRIEPGRHAQDPDILAGQLAAHGLGQADLAGLRPRCSWGRRRLAAVDGCDHDDHPAAAGAQVGQRRARDAQGREEVAIEDGAQVLLVGAGQIARARAAHVVDHDVDAAVGADGGRPPAPRRRRDR